MNGTGIVVGNNTILTVAHNFIDRRQETNLKSLVAWLRMYDYITIGSCEIHTNGKPDTTHCQLPPYDIGYRNYTVNKEDFWLLQPCPISITLAQGVSIEWQNDAVCAMRLANTV